MKLKYLLILIILAILCLDETNGNRRNKKNKKHRQGQKTDQKTESLFVLNEIPGIGKVRGAYGKTSWTGKTIFQFFDIKYGEAQRFKIAKPAQPWKNIRRAMRSRQGCPSLQDLNLVKRFESNGNIEDCLTLSISTKSFQSKLPVMVYLHGEFLYEGTNNEASPEYLLENDVILVSIRYRLGPFGFLSTMSEDIAGNFAVTDVKLALEWIQENIHAFGGDPKSVTLFGQVGGAALANVLTMSPIVPEGLFHRVIYHSGTALTPIFTTDKPLEFTKDIASEAGCKGIDDLDKLNWCLENMTPSQLLKAFSAHGIKNTHKGIDNFGGVQFVIGGPSGVLPEHPGKLIRAKKIKYYPTMGGVVKNAGTFVLREIYEDQFNETMPDSTYTAAQYIDFIISQTNGEDPSNSWKKYAEREFFTKKDRYNGTFIDLLPGLIDMCGTIPFKNPILLTLQANAEKLPNQTYLYSFDYEGEFHRYLEDFEETLNLPFELGASLTDELLYLFPWPSHAKFLNSRDTKIARKMVDLWTSFATTGVPISYSVNDWPPMTEPNGPYLKINRITTIGQNFLNEYSATVREDTAGYNLVSLEYFENIYELNQEKAEKEKKQKEKLEQEQKLQQQNESEESDEDEPDDNNDEEEFEVNPKKKRKNKRKSNTKVPKTEYLEKEHKNLLNLSNQNPLNVENSST